MSIFLVITEKNLINTFTNICEINKNAFLVHYDGTINSFRSIIFKLKFTGVKIFFVEVYCGMKELPINEHEKVLVTNYDTNYFEVDKWIQDCISKT